MLNKKIGFTLTEVLLAVSIVGIIAALVLPGVITKYQETVFESKYNRIVNELDTLIQGLSIYEGVEDYCKTSLHQPGPHGDHPYENSVAPILKKYFKISRYCGTTDNSTEKEVIKKQCFAETYYEYDYQKDAEGNVIEPKQIVDKKTFSPGFGGACAVLKNGASICLTDSGSYYGGPWNPHGHIDVNGPKGPNILNKDLRTFNIKTPDCKPNLDRTTKTVISY